MIQIDAGGFRIELPDNATDEDIKLALLMLNEQTGGASVPQPQQPQAGVIEETGRGLVWTAAKIGDTVPTVGNVVIDAVNWAGRQIGIDSQIPRATMVSDYASEPTTQGVKTLAEVGAMFPGAIKGAAMAPQIYNTATRMGKFGNWAARSMGASAGAQATTGEFEAQDFMIDGAIDMVISSVPAVRMLKPLLRPKGYGTAEQLARLDAADEMGISPSLSVIMDSPSLATTTAAVSKMPFASGIIKTAADAEQKAANDYVMKLVDDLGGHNISPEAMGQIIRAGLERASKAFKLKSHRLYADVQPFIPGGAINTDNYFNLLDEIVGRTEFNKILQQGTTDPVLLKQYHAMLDAKAAPGAANDVMDWSTAYALREMILESISKPGTAFRNTSDADKWRLVGALTEDLGNTVSGTGGRHLWDKANEHYKNYLQPLIDLETMLMRGTPADTYRTVFGSPEVRSKVLNESVATSLINTMPKNAADAIRAEMLYRMTRETVGQGGLTRDFSFAEYLSAFKRYNDNNTLDAIFGQPLTSKLQTMAIYSDGVVESAKHRNFSNSGHVGGVLAGGAGVGALVTNPVVALLTASIPMASAYGAAKLLTNPKFLDWLGTAPVMGAKANFIQEWGGKLMFIYAHADDDEQKSFEEALQD